MLRIPLSILGFGLSIALAADRTPWVEPPEAPISPTGTVIAVENYRCEVASPYLIKCLNVGRVCREFRAAEEARTARTFGCGLKDSPNYPCEPWDKTTEHIHNTLNLSMTCTPMLIGGW